MGSKIVQFRVSDEDLEYLERKGIRTNDAARQQFHRFVSSLRFRDAMKQPRKPRSRKRLPIDDTKIWSRDDLDHRH